MGTCCGEKRDQIRNAERLPLSCLLKVIMLMIRGVDKATFHTWEKIEATGMAMAVYLFGFILNHSFHHLMKGQRFGAFFCDQKLELKQMCSSTLEAMINKRAPSRLLSPISLTSFFLRQRQQTELLLKELATCT